MPDWSTIAAAFTKLGGWTSAFFAAAGVVFFILRERQLLDLHLVEPWVGAVIGLATLGSAAVSLGALATWLTKCASRGWNYWSEVRATNRRKYATLLHLRTLTETEQAIFGYLLAKNERSFESAQDGGWASSLYAKGLAIPRHDIPYHLDDRTFIIPDYVWQELLKMKSELPNTHKPGEALPWRRPWYVG